MSGAVLAHAGGGEASTLPETVVLVGLAATVVAGYLAGARRLRSAGGSPRAWASWAWRPYCFLAGVLAVVVVLLPALDPVVDASFPLHMAQHLVLMFVAAPLLALGAPGVPLLLLLPRPGRRRVAAVRARPAVRRLRSAAVLPGVGVAGYSAILLVWHLPVVFSAALESDTVHITEHACFLLAGWLLWAPLAAPQRALDGGRAVLYVFVSGFPMSLLGAVLVMAPRALYPAQTGIGEHALAAQQMAGALMWIPPGILSVALCAVLVLVWFRRMEGSTPGGAPLPPPIPPPLPAPAPARVAAREVHP
jgi:putative membrane protein